MQLLKTELEAFQIITIQLDKDEVLEPSILQNLSLPEVDYKKGIVIDGRAPRKAICPYSCKFGI
jgi:CRISPR-associated Csx3 family protein